MNMEKRAVYEFGDFVLEGERRRLVRRESGEPVALTGKVFDTLLCLIERRGETLDKETLLGIIWPGVVVEENSLTQNISALRQILGETRTENRYIATVPRKGYRFVGEVTERITTAPRLEQVAAAPVSSPKRTLRALWVNLAVAGVLVVVAFLLYQRGGRQPAPSVIRTLAVLPFKPLLAAERDEPLELGMTESMIGKLDARGGLTIYPLSSVRRYASVERDPVAAGRALNAESVLDGALQHHGDQLRVSARLLRVKDGQQLWAGQFEGGVDNVLGFQEQISAKVAQTLAAQASPAVAPPVLGGTQDSTAYLLYAHGRYALARSSEPSLVLAIDYFQKAIVRDPQFARAHSGLAACYMVMGNFGMRSPGEVFPRARDAVLTALRIEPRLAAAYGTLGHIKMQYDRDWEGAEADFTRAIKLDPLLAEPHLYWGVLLAMRGELDRGLEELKRAQQLEPLLTLPKTRAGTLFYFAHRYEEAIAQLEESVALDDRPDVAHTALGRAYMHTGRYDLAAAEFAKTHGPSPGSFGDMGQLLALSGRRAEALAELDRLLKLSTQRYVSAIDIAAVYASLGDTENSLAWLDRALEQRASTLGFLAQNPAFDILHGSPEFAQILDRIGLQKRPLAK
jgi:DNA-binding winged helix-turn-helix (wHTH) protein/tetratricopeptide (TPR) repeat protein